MSDGLPEEMVLAALTALLGADSVSTDASECVRAASSWYPLVAKERVAAAGAGDEIGRRFAAVARPGTTAEVAAVVRWANSYRVQITPVGGASNTVGSNLPDPDRIAIALDLSRLTDVRWEEESLTVYAGAGCRLAEVEEQLGRHHYTLGHLLGSANLATVGGSVASGAIGVFSGRYGSLRSGTLGLDVVLPTGEVVRTTAQGAGVNLHPLLIGSEGALGIVTEAALAIAPQPDVRAWAIFSFTRLDDAFDALRLVYRSDSRPTAARLFDPDAARRLNTEDSALPAGSSLLLLGFEGSELVQTGSYQMAYAVCQKVGGEAQPAEIGDTWFEKRTAATGLFTANARPGGLADVFSVWAPWTRVKAVHTAMRRAAAPLITGLACEAAHADPHGVALDLWWEAQAEPATLPETRFLHTRISEAVLSAALDAGAETIAHHGGIGAARRPFIERERGAAQTAALQVLKAALDPNGVLPPI